MSLGYAILGFLSYRPMTGYDLKKAFDGSVRHFWPADQSQIYRTLKGLHEEGLIDMEVFPREERPDVKEYAITAEGESALREWLATPLPPADTREPFLIQLYFAFLLQDEQALRLVEAEIAQVEALLEMYEGIYHGAMAQERTAGDERPLFYSMLTLEFGTRANVWYRDWLRSVRDRIEAGDWAVLPLEAFLA